MERKIYISNGIINLTEYLPCDDKYSYNDWLDIETQKGYNFEFNESYENFIRQEINQRFHASIIHNENKLLIGEIGISPINTIPDLAIRIYKPFRMQGYGTIAFMLGTQYAIENLNIGEIHVGCYKDNIGSLKMLQKCGYIPYPEGNQQEKHFITNEDIIQLDFIFRRNNIKLVQKL